MFCGSSEGGVTFKPITLSHGMSRQAIDMLGRPPTNEKGKVDSFSYDESRHKHNDVNLTMRRAR